jgi:hypothetical protein
MDINTLTMPVELIVIPFVEGTMPSRDAIRERICKWGSPELEMVIQPRYSTNGRCETEKLEDNTKPGNLEHHQLQKPPPHW